MVFGGKSDPTGFDFSNDALCSGAQAIGSHVILDTGRTAIIFILDKKQRSTGKHSP